MPGKEIKGRSKIATYSHGGRTGLKKGTHPKGKTESSMKQSKEHAKTKYGVKQFFEPNYDSIRKREFRSWKRKKT